MKCLLGRLAVTFLLIKRVLDSWTPGLKIRRGMLSCRYALAPESLLCFLKDVMFYNVFTGRVLCWAFCKYRPPLSELCEDPLEAPGGEGHYSDSPGGSELPPQDLQGWRRASWA